MFYRKRIHPIKNQFCRYIEGRVLALDRGDSGVVFRIRVEVVDILFALISRNGELATRHEQHLIPLMVWAVVCIGSNFWQNHVLPLLAGSIGKFRKQALVGNLVGQQGIALTDGAPVGRRSVGHFEIHRINFNPHGEGGFDVHLESSPCQFLQDFNGVYLRKVVRHDWPVRLTERSHPEQKCSAYLPHNCYSLDSIPQRLVVEGKWIFLSNRTTTHERSKNNSFVRAYYTHPLWCRSHVC